jgi:hypothetical protein
VPWTFERITDAVFAGAWMYPELLRVCESVSWLIIAGFETKNKM